MNATRFVSLTLSFAGVASAQVQVGELMVNTQTPGPTRGGGLRHYLQDGTLVQSVDVVGEGWGSCILPSGLWAVTKFSPLSGLIVVDPVTGTEVTNVVTPDVTAPMDVESRADGTLLVADADASPPSFFRYDQAGNLLEAIPVNFGGCLKWFAIAPEGDIWAPDGCAPVIRHIDADGTLLGTFSVPEWMADIAVDEDGTLWTVPWLGSSTVYHYAPDGTLLGSFDAGVGQLTGIAVMPDGTLWITDFDGGGDLHHFDPSGTPLGIFGDPFGKSAVTISTPRDARLGANYCDALPNSTGRSGALVATGSEVASENDVTLLAEFLPPGEWGYVLNSLTAGSQAVGDGVLCLSGGIGRHTSQVANSGIAGAIVTELDLTALPRPNGAPHFVVAGETWYFTLWHRDGSSSNFTDGVAITFQ